MFSNPNKFYQSALQQVLGKSVDIIENSVISGGCINHAEKLVTSEGIYFLKYNHQMPLHFFEVEKNGLSLLKEKSTFTIPEVIGLGTLEETQFIVIEYIDSKRTIDDYWESLGTKLADFIRTVVASFGGVEDNYIGSYRSLITIDRMVGLLYF